MAGEMDVQEVVQAITDAATELSGAQFGAFFYNVINDKGESYMLYTLSGVPREHFSKFPMPRNTEVFAPTFSGSGIVRSDDITKDPRYGKNAPHHGQPKGHLPVRSYLAVPVFSRSREVLGGLFFGHSDVGVFDKQSEDVVEAIASHAGIALDNARLHQEIKDNMERFQQLANSIPQLAWMAKPTGEVFWFNSRWHEYTGSTAQTQTGKSWETALEPSEFFRVMENWKQSLETGTPWEDTFSIRRHDGAFRSHLSRAHPFRDRAGKIVLWFGTNTDISDQQNLMKDREQLLDAERAARTEAERVSRMKDEFLATLSHELRTPLNAILGWSHVMRKSTTDPNMMLEGLNVIERNARAQTQLIEDLLDMSRIISGKIRLDVQRVDFASIVNIAIESVRPSADAREIRIRTVLDPLAGPVAGDPNRLQQIVWNILSNAIKFTPKGGKIEVLLSRVNSHVELVISDTGKGITPDFLPFVFERFRQGDSSTTRQHGGLGIGLAIVKHLVELHGGQVRVKSEGEGRGATFTVEFPVAVTKYADRPHDEHHSSHYRSFENEKISLAGLVVLVVDDETDTRELLRRVLTENGAKVFLADSADMGLQIVKNETINILISDIGMPQKDGYEFIRAVRQFPPHKGGKIPAIALTAFARSEDRTRAMMAGYQSHIAKPAEPQEILATVASIAGRTGK
jgi:PAS domain S-box-containing protein